MQWLPLTPTWLRLSMLTRATAAAGMLGALAACTSLGGAGPSTSAIRHGQKELETFADTGIQVLRADSQVLSGLSVFERTSSFFELFGDTAVSATLIAPGDLIDVAIWEAPPAVLFGVSRIEPNLSADPQLATTSDIPRQQVDEDGHITIPFVGRIAVVGMSPGQVEAIIVSRLRQRANNPQAVVRLAENASRTATILGEVAVSRRISLSARGERLLDAVAEAGGSRQPIEQTTVLLARGAKRGVMPLEGVINDPVQNVRLRPGDVVTVQHQPFSFVALGAVNRNAEVPFEGSGISLAEALGRVGGLNDRRADVKGVFVFRLEHREALPALQEPGVQATAQGRVPVVYTFALTDAASLFAMQDFRMRDADVLYVSTAPGVELERFLQTISSTAFSIIAAGNALDGQ